MGDEFNVLNFGVGGWGFAEYFLAFKKYFKDYSPELVIIGVFGGNDFEDLYNALTSPHNGSPKMIIAHTIKGKGISFMEDKLEWHYKCPDEDQLKHAIEELENS